MLRVGLLEDGRVALATRRAVVAADREVLGQGPAGLGRLIGDFDALRDRIERWAADGTVLSQTQVAPAAPLARPAKVLVTMRARTTGPASPIELHTYLKADPAIVGDRATIVLPDAAGAGLFTHDGCLAVVIGRRTRALPAARWREAVFGYTAMIDVTARTAAGARWKDGRSCLGGSFDGFGPMGPWLVPRGELGEAATIAVRLRVNGEVRQDHRLDLDREIGEAIATASTVMTLHPGDVLALQGPATGQGPLQDGDEVALDVGPVGTLRATVRDPLRRSWPANLRLDATADDTDVRALVQ